jgi:S1-C subfamily serine protease
MIRFACPSCRRRYFIENHRAGEKTICLQCRKPLVVPSLLTAEATPLSTLTPSKVQPAPKPQQPKRAIYSWLLGAAVAGIVLSAGAILAWSLFGHQDHAAELTDDRPNGSNLAEETEKAKAGEQSKEFAQRKDTSRPSSEALSPELLFKSASPAVVQIFTQSWDDELGSGSGFLVSQDGLIATNFHVIRGACRARVEFANGSSFEVEDAAAVNERSDLAVLKINGQNLPCLELADGDLPPVGSKVFAIGSPERLTNTLSDGLVSGHRLIADMTFIQTTAPISHGSSGGPLLAANGKVVGVTGAGVDDAQNLNFAVPVEALSKLLRERGPLQSLASVSGKPPPRRTEANRPVAVPPSSVVRGPIVFQPPPVMNRPAGWTDEDKETLAHFFRAHKVGQDASAALNSRLARGKPRLARKDWIALSDRFVAAIDEAKIAARGNLGRFHPELPVAFRMKYLWYLELTKRNIEQEGKFGVVEEHFWLQQWQEWLTANRKDVRFPDEVPVRRGEGLTDEWARKSTLFKGLSLPKFVP